MFFVFFTWAAFSFLSETYIWPVSFILGTGHYLCREGGGGGRGREKRRGIKAVFDWQEGGGVIFFKTINMGDVIYVF